MLYAPNFACIFYNGGTVDIWNLKDIERVVLASSLFKFRSPLASPHQLPLLSLSTPLTTHSWHPSPLSSHNSLPAPLWPLSLGTSLTNCPLLPVTCAVSLFPSLPLFHSPSIITRLSLYSNAPPPFLFATSRSSRVQGSLAGIEERGWPQLPLNWKGKCTRNLRGASRHRRWCQALLMPFFFLCTTLCVPCILSATLSLGTPLTWHPSHLVCIPLTLPLLSFPSFCNNSLSTPVLTLCIMLPSLNLCYFLRFPAIDSHWDSIVRSIYEK